MKTAKNIIIYLSVLVSSVFINTTPVLGKSSFTINLDNSKITWIGRKLTENHTGNVKIKGGKITKKGNSFQGYIIIDMNSISCTDIKSPKYNQKLVNHLKSKDFFYTNKYKTSTLKITSTKKKSKSKYIIYGNIKIRGKTEKINFPVEIEFSKKYFKAKGKLNIDRTKFNVKYNSGKFFKSLGDKLIYDNFTLIFQIQSK